jgi:hypothetical protein
VRRPLVQARRHGSRWEVEPLPAGPPFSTVPLELNEARYVLESSNGRPQSRWDVRCRRLLVPQAGASSKDAYVELVEGVHGARVVECDAPGFTSEDEGVPARLRLPLDRPVSYRLVDGLCRTVEEAARVYEPGVAFEWVALLDRFGSKVARLVLEGLPAQGPAPFGSSIDVTTGLEKPVRVEWSGGRAVLELRNSPPRSLLRLYWPLEQHGRYPG